jgi:hypothetical protein
VEIQRDRHADRGSLRSALAKQRFRRESQRTEQHEGLLALACLEARLSKKHERLQSLYRWLINVKLRAGTPRILLAHSDGGIVPAEMRCISGEVSLIGAVKSCDGRAYLALTAYIA